MKALALPLPWSPRWAALPRETRDTLFLLAVIAWVLLPLAAHVPLWCSAAATAVLLWRGWIAATGRALPRRRWTLLLLGLTMLATALSFRTLFGRDAGVTLIAVLLTLKTLEMRARRDAFVLFFLGFFAMLTNFFYSQSLLTALAMLVGLLGLLTALVNAHRPVGRPTLASSARTAALMALAGAPVMVALFVLFPRFSPLWGMPSDALVGKSGLSSTMKVGAIAELVLDDRVALRIRFDDAPPAQRDLYFRGPVLSRFDGREWTARGGGEGFEAVGAGPLHDLQVDGPPVRYEVTMEPSNRPWLLLLDSAASAPELPPRRGARVNGDLQWLSDRPITEPLRYRAESHVRFRYGLAGWDGRPRQDLPHFLALPNGFNPRTLALARELRAAHPQADALAMAELALERLRSGGYTYTLEPGVNGQHSADEFWFDTKAGFCEHISSAFVILMRGAGVPARIVTGFQGGERNPLDGYWTVRNADAHAWAEVWQPDRGWIRVDPTSAVSPGRIGAFERLRAPDGVVASAIGALSPTLIAQLRQAWEALNNAWTQNILNYTQGRQFDLLRALGFEQPDWRDLLRLLAGLLAAVALAAGAWSLWERRQHDPWLRLLQRARQRLAAAGLAVPPQASPRALWALVQAQDTLPPTEQARLGEWLLALERWRYAQPSAAAPNAAGAAGAAGAPQQLATLRAAFARLPWPARPR